MVVDGDLVKIRAWYNNEWGSNDSRDKRALPLTRPVEAAAKQEDCRSKKIERTQLTDPSFIYILKKLKNN